MSRVSRKKRKLRAKPLCSGASTPDAEQAQAKEHRNAPDRAGSEGWFTAKRPILWFVLLVSTLTLGFNGLFYLWLSETSAFESYLDLNAVLSAGALTAIGQDVVAAGTSLLGPGFSLDINIGCDGLQASAFFGFLVLASPLRTPVWGRLLAVAVGVTALLFLNLLRILSLYLTGVYFPRAFDIMHVEVWQALFIVLPVLLWLLWVRRQSRLALLHTHASD